MKASSVVLALSLGVPALAGAQMAPAPMSNPGQPPKGDQADTLPDIDPKIGNDVNLTYAQAEKAFENHDWLEAIAYYQHLNAKFSYNVTLSALAQLRLGDIAFAREKFLEAKEYYKQFLKMHPRHEKADYAAFQMGMCAYKDIPGEFILFPPGFERDQSEVRTARNSLADFLTKYPKSEYAPKAKEILVKCDDKLADHELYVARYYVSKEKWAGSASRAEGLAKTYPDSTHVPDALLIAIKSRTKLGQAAEAQKNYELLASLNPGEGVLKKAQAEMAKP